MEGWLLRASQGFSHRGNSVLPVGAGSDEQIARAEQWYVDRGLEPCFQLTDGVPGAPELAARLAARGYEDRPEGRAQIWIASLDRTPASAEQKLPVALDPAPSRGWVETWLNLLGDTRTDPTVPLELLETARCEGQVFARLQVDDATASVTYGALGDGWLGLYCVVTAEAQRRQGAARRVLNEVLSWGVQQGANKAYLQVEADNVAAQHLYDSLGFRHLADYRYLEAPSGGYL